jgi:anti-sigma factor RsiW
MNCRRFQHELYEYLDGTLSPGAQAAAERHLSECAACRQRLGQQQEVARSLSDGFRQATESLQLPPGAGRRVLAALANERAVPVQPQGSVLFWQRLAWPLAMAAVVSLLLAGWFCFMRAPGPGKAGPQLPLARGGVAVQLSYVVPVYTFRQEGEFVIDALTCQTNVVNERLQTELARLE